jgi:Coenzyme PQQ synthesis protein D (PqqD)
MREAMSQVSPRARKEGIIVQDLTGELLIYDLDRHTAHCLNESAALIWKRCDGRTSVAELARALEQSKAPASEDVICMAVSDLRKRHLLADAGDVPKGASRLSRREMIRRVGIAAAVGLPLVTSIIAPSAMQAASCTCVPPTTECCASGCPCTTSNMCCTGICTGGKCL